MFSQLHQPEKFVLILTPYEYYFLVLVWFILKAQSSCVKLIHSRLPVKTIPQGNRNISEKKKNWPCWIHSFHLITLASGNVCVTDYRICNIKAVNKALLFTANLSVEGGQSVCVQYAVLVPTQCIFWTRLVSVSATSCDCVVLGGLVYMCQYYPLNHWF